MFCEWIKHHVPNWEDCVVLSPDEGGAQKSASVAADLGLDFALIHTRDMSKHRYHAARMNGGGGGGSGGDRSRRSHTPSINGGEYKPTKFTLLLLLLLLYCTSCCLIDAIRIQK